MRSKELSTRPGATYEIIAPKITGVEASDKSWIVADQMIDGGPSVLYDAVALLPAPAAMDDLLQESSARDFVADAFAHCKFIGYVEICRAAIREGGCRRRGFRRGLHRHRKRKGRKVVCRRPVQVARLGTRTQGEDALEIKVNHERPRVGWQPSSSTSSAHESRIPRGGIARGYWPVAGSNMHCSVGLAILVKVGPISDCLDAGTQADSIVGTPVSLMPRSKASRRSASSTVAAA